ncbi:uncharacterized protein VDAG_09436 [Verticillium dahliae VdLs.17]|uniref:Uncharacterized protein n=3 Tax=Verticillium TaxID=1036719 RepID=G2XH04_VERDV|nr:uncharacterized protein VDAG_09436 [Verticillium dahliae VdLs.17]EGY19102.1 hypothetical protein VDAG_09436 [Verticillium dahliae VdLs.17]
MRTNKCSIQGGRGPVEGAAKTMCQVHSYRCPTCKTRWQQRRRLASCDEGAPNGSDPECPESLCMYAGDPQVPVRRQCATCVGLAAMLKEYEEDVAAQLDAKLG